ncbi:hypothetical protein, variant [Verruconis gallopava]|uniref:Transcription and mRNA export factor SUS1 n=1 Tax=Verruconis gallopava TaxID=253628 RepID=A0A0D2AB08_9PEZI|nr:hypothetical protein, variant [Verruconis gallopava]KIW03795.1 hypothetical protein, variant [Verruconis gallopava]
MSDTTKLHDTLSTALLEAHSIPAIEKVLAQSLAEAGWTTELRAYIQRLVRSGECTNYQQILKKVMAAVTTGKEGSANGAVQNGEGDAAAANANTTNAVGTSDLRIPEKVVRDGVMAVRKELEKVVTIDVDD